MEKQSKHDNDPLFVREATVRELLSWNECVDAMESALVAALSDRKSADQPFSLQTSRTFTAVPGRGVLLTMPGFCGNYSMNMVTGNAKHSTLACKLVTSFGGNSKMNPPLPSILANILMFDSDNGRLKAIVEATEITAWRTAAVSLAATKHLFVNRRPMSERRNCVLAVCGAGTQVI